VVVGMTGFEPCGAENPDESRYFIGAENEPARLVLKRALDAIGAKRGQFTWMLLYGNQETENLYALNLLPVPPAVTRKPAPVGQSGARVPAVAGGSNNGNEVPLPK
jgi:hypothetical protein